MDRATTPSMTEAPADEVPPTSDVPYQGPKINVKESKKIICISRDPFLV